MEALESFVASMRGTGADEDEGARYATAADGRTYKTILATRQ